MPSENKNHIPKLLTCLLLSLPLSANAGLDDLLKQATEAAAVLQPKAADTATAPATNSTTPAADTSFIDQLTGGEISGGLKAALKQGTKTAITALSADGGFSNSDYKINIPQALEPLESILRKVGQGKIVDDFVASMNKAAEQAIPQAQAIFDKAIDAMSLSDAANILKSSDDAATQYFKQHTQSDLAAKIAPVIKKAMDANGVTASYKKIMDSANQYGGGLLSNMLGQQSQDIDQYVTNQSLDALFTRIAEEEKQIRSNPVARSSDLLKKVFNF